MNIQLNGRVRAAVGALVLMAGAAPTLGQTALGDGRTLEKDLRVGGPGEVSTGLLQRPNFNNIVKARNAAVTGNAANGQSLMIPRPYSAPEDFRGVLGTDTLFRFQRDSLNSSAYMHPLYQQSGPNRYQGLWQAPAPVVTRLDTFGAGTELPRAGNIIRSAAAPPHARVNINPDIAPEATISIPPSTVNGKDTGELITNPVGTLRSFSASTATTELNPAVVGYTRSARGVQSVTASSLLGVRQTTPNKYVRPTERQEAEQPPAKSAMDAMGLNAASEGPKLSATNQQQFRTSYDDLSDRLAASGVVVTPPSTTATPGGVQPAGAQAPEKILPAGVRPPEVTKEKPKAAAEEAKAPTWQERIERLRVRLEKGKEKAAKGQPEEGLTREQAKAQDLTQPKPQSEPGKGDAGAAPKGSKDKKKSLTALDDETLAILRKAGGEAKTYTTGTPGSLFESHLKAGEEDLAQGHYFDAEERFARALSMHPGDATVQAARLNAQIGAGLYLSAATNLRQLYQQHPEVIGVHYTGKTMPSAERLKLMIEEMRQNISKAKKENQPTPDEAGLLLAYVGYQTSDEGAVREGLAALRESKDGSTDPLVPILEGVWVGKDAK
jgi:hypothetical protein